MSPEAPAGLGHEPEHEEEKSTRWLLINVFPPIVVPVFLAVIDQTIVAAALPSIAGSLGEVERITWVVISYLVANTIAAPVYGRVADRFGRRRLMFAALILFVVASLLCAVSNSIVMLTVARVLQGFGGGGLMTLSQALIGEAVSPRQRGNFQGYLATVIVMSSAFGPVAGGFLTHAFGWRSVFLINLPFGLIAMLLLLRLPPARMSGGRFHFDGIGLVLLTGFVAPLLIALESARRLDPAMVGIIAVMGAISVGSLLLLVRQERRTRSPLIPIGLLSQPAMWRSAAMSGCAGAALVSLITFLPIYLRVVGRAGAGEIGFLLLPLTAGIGTGSAITGRLISRTGRTAIFPSITLIVTVAVMLTLTFIAARLDNLSLMALVSLGAFCQGSAMPVAQITAQAVAGARQLGAAAGLVQLSRSLGAAFGVAVAGAALFGLLASTDPKTASLFADMVQIGPDVIDTLPAAEQALVQSEIGEAFRAVFLTVAAFASVILALAWTMPDRKV